MFSPLFFRTKNIVSHQKKKKRAVEYPRPPREARKVVGLCLTWPKATREERNNAASHKTLAAALCLSHSWLKTMKWNKKRLYFSLCLVENLSHSLSLPWLKLVLLPYPWLKIRKGRRKGALPASISLFFGPSKKYIYIKEEIAKASLLLVNVKSVTDKSWEETNI